MDVKVNGINVLSWHAQPPEVFWKYLEKKIESHSFFVTLIYVLRNWGVTVPVVCHDFQSGGHVLRSQEPDLLVTLLDEVSQGLVQMEAQFLHTGPRASQAVIGVMLSWRKCSVYHFSIGVIHLTRRKRKKGNTSDTSLMLKALTCINVKLKKY